MGDMSLVLYRQATKNDAENLKDIAKRIINTNYVPFLGTDLTATFIESGMSDQEIDEGLTNCTLMVYNGQIIGFVITNKDILHLIMIDVPFQNVGYGSALLAHIEEKLFLNYKCIYLQSFKDNEPSTQFYLKNGWILISEEEVPELGKIMSQFEKHKGINESNLHIT
jgi:RimJ/RimL family protein N-acetyltransferase